MQQFISELQSLVPVTPKANPIAEVKILGGAFSAIGDWFSQAANDVFMAWVDDNFTKAELADLLLCLEYAASVAPDKPREYI